MMHDYQDRMRLLSHTIADLSRIVVDVYVENMIPLNVFLVNKAIEAERIAIINLPPRDKELFMVLTMCHDAAWRADLKMADFGFLPNEAQNYLRRLIGIKGQTQSEWATAIDRCPICRWVVVATGYNTPRGNP